MMLDPSRSTVSPPDDSNSQDLGSSAHQQIQHRQESGICGGELIRATSRGGRSSSVCSLDDDMLDYSDEELDSDISVDTMDFDFNSGGGQHNGIISDNSWDVEGTATTVTSTSTSLGNNSGAMQKSGSGSAFLNAETSLGLKIASLKNKLLSCGAISPSSGGRSHDVCSSGEVDAEDEDNIMKEKVSISYYNYNLHVV